MPGNEALLYPFLNEERTYKEEEEEGGGGRGEGRGEAR